MARPHRINAPGALYHLTTRGNLQADIYLRQVDRDVFLEIVADTVERHEWICHS
jgi:hypothetical protein